MDWCRPIGRDRALALRGWGAACHSLGAGPLAVAGLAGFRGVPGAAASGRLAAGLRGGGGALHSGLSLLTGWTGPVVDYAAAVVAPLATVRTSVRALASNPTAAASGFGAALTGAEAACDSPARTAAVAATAVVANAASEPSRGPDATSDAATAT
ncbi:hypothetical protein IC232_28945 [Microvirga sp. BT688]|uniref:hypothetical protein n=1 Tax=Microvirga sp. TaxID=1873136 RepID=UPI001681D932|nr:hypothetical protein [Microvirga sp.]MBD2750678.1 hypothetical protein [Microvirga sp.]